MTEQKQKQTPTYVFWLEMLWVCLGAAFMVELCVAETVLDAIKYGVGSLMWVANNIFFVNYYVNHYGKN